MKKISRITALLLSAMLILCSCGEKKDAVKIVIKNCGLKQFTNDVLTATSFLKRKTQKKNNEMMQLIQQNFQMLSFEDNSSFLAKKR